jgi:hypothetical protein
MRFKIFILTILILCTQLCSAQLKKEYQPLVIKFIELVKNNKKDAIANLVSFPFGREYPISSIKNKQEFIKRFDEIFDATLKNMIIQSKLATDWSDVGWRGIMLKDGEIWIDYDGKLIGVNYQSKFEKESRQNLIAVEKNTLHSSIKKFESPVHILETKNYRVRIDDLGNYNYRYSSWPISKSMNDKPDLIINNGEWIPDGSGGNHRFQFKNAEYIYDCSIIVLGEDNSPPAMLTIYKGEKEILSQNAKIVIK